MWPVPGDEQRTMSPVLGKPREHVKPSRGTIGKPGYHNSESQAGPEWSQGNSSDTGLWGPPVACLEMHCCGKPAATRWTIIGTWASQRCLPSPVPGGLHSYSNDCDVARNSLESQICWRACFILAMWPGLRVLDLSCHPRPHCHVLTRRRALPAAHRQSGLECGSRVRDVSDNAG